MTAQSEYEVTVFRVGEGEHQPPQETFRTDMVELGEDGSLRFSGRTFGATTWGSFELIRVPSAAPSKRRV
jgi:hypothetical protein